MAGVQSIARPYRRFVLPSLHRRFTNAAVLSFGVCLVEALWMGHYESLWQACGTILVRTTLLFISILAVFVLRVANMHVGTRTTVSPIQTFTTYIFSWPAVRCLSWYLFSAWFFCEVYMWSADPSVELGIMEYGRAFERPRLNERPIFLRSLFLTLGLVQAVIHLAYDYDEIALPAAKLDRKLEDLTRQNQRPLFAPLTMLRSNAVPLLARSLQRVVIVTAVGPFLYWLLVRQTAWSWAYWAAKLVFTLPKYSAKPPAAPPGLPGIMGRFLVEGFLLVLSWEVANASFNVFLPQEPLKQGRLLTAESLDANGSLLSGLKTSRPIPKTFAFWELGLIALHYGDRRQLIYSDIDRAGGSTWSQIMIVCLAELHGVVKRIQDETSNSSPATAPASSQDLAGLPKLGSTLKDGNVFPKAAPVPFAQLRGSSPNNRFVESSATKLIDFAAHHANPPQSVAKSSLPEVGRSSMVKFLHHPLGAPLRQTFARRAAAVVLGTPTSKLSTILDSITAVTKLVVHSKREDKLGTVWRDVPNIIRTFTSTHTAVESFLQRLAPDWTDVRFQPVDRRGSAEVECVLHALRDGLREIVSEFGEFSDSMGLGLQELRAAKEIAAKGGERAQDKRTIGLA